MGFFSEAMDNVLGMDPGPQGANPAFLAWQREQERLAAQQQAQLAQQQQPAAPPTPPAPPPEAPAAPVAPQGSVFDPSPYRSQVDTGFSQFTPEFYAQKYAAAYDPYKQGVEGQYGFAKDALTAGVAKRGLTNSQQGRGLFQQLDALRDQALNTGQQSAQGFQTSLSDQVGAAKNSLYGSIAEGADNASVGSRAQTEASKLAGTAAPSNSLGDIFGSLVQPYATSRSPGGPVNPELQAFSTGSNLNLAGGAGGPSIGQGVSGSEKEEVLSMCTGIEIALLAGGAAASAGGAMLQRKEQQSNAAAQARARNQELRDSMARQRRYEDRSRSEGVNKALDRFDPAEQAKAQAEDAARRDTAITEAVTPTAGAEDIPLASGEDGAPQVVKGIIGKKLRDVFNTATDRAKLAAKPLTFSDMLAGNNISLTEAGRVVDTGNSFARQEAAMLPSQQDFAAYAAQELPSIWGPLLSAGGSALAGLGGSGYLGAAKKVAAPLLTGAGTALPISTLTGRVAGPV